MYKSEENLPTFFMEIHQTNYLYQFDVSHCVF
jgi:hypothetical protein